MRVFPKAIVLTNKPCSDVKRTYCLNARLCGEAIASGKTGVSAIGSSTNIFLKIFKNVLFLIHSDLYI